jgi:hypothetical protein
LDILHTYMYDASVDLGHQTLHLVEEEVSIWSPGMGPWHSSLVVANDLMIPAQCEVVVTAQLRSPVKVENGLVEPSPEAHPPEGLYIDRTLMRDHREVRVWVANATCHEQELMKGSPMAHCEPVMLVIPPNVEQPQICNTTPELQDVIAAAKPNLSDTESQELEEFLTKYGDIFAIGSDDYGQADNVPLYRYGRGLTNSSTPEDTRLSKTGGSGQDAQGHATSWGYRRVRQPLVIPHPRLEELGPGFCVHCRKLNDVTRKDCFLLPQIDGTLDSMTSAKWLSKLNLKSSYWQVDLHPDDKEED